MEPKTSTTELTQQDLKAIRKILPGNYRQQLVMSEEARQLGITERLITESFALRTRNFEAALLVFNPIITKLVELGQTDLADKCRQRVELCRQAQSISTPF